MPDCSLQYIDKIKLIIVFRNKSRKRQKLEQKRLKLEAAKTERTKKEIEIHMLLGFMNLDIILPVYIMTMIKPG